MITFRSKCTSYNVLPRMQQITYSPKQIHEFIPINMPMDICREVHKYLLYGRIPTGIKVLYTHAKELVTGSVKDIHIYERYKRVKIISTNANTIIYYYDDREIYRTPAYDVKTYYLHGMDALIVVKMPNELVEEAVLLTPTIHSVEVSLTIQQLEDIRAISGVKYILNYGNMTEILAVLCNGIIYHCEIELSCIVRQKYIRYPNVYVEMNCGNKYLIVTQSPYEVRVTNLFDDSRPSRYLSYITDRDELYENASSRYFQENESTCPSVVVFDYALIQNSGVIRWITIIPFFGGYITFVDVKKIHEAADYSRGVCKWLDYNIARCTVFDAADPNFTPMPYVPITDFATPEYQKYVESKPHQHNHKKCNIELNAEQFIEPIKFAGRRGDMFYIYSNSTIYTWDYTG